MTVETEVANLTTAVDGLTSAVNVSKATLDASVADAESAQTGAQSARDTTLGYKNSAEAAATSATNTASALTGFDLSAINDTITDTAVDVFVYDTSKDSDGGAWRKRTQGTSWYNETLNTSTRGNRKEFPAVAVIVAESDTVTIYDGDDPSLPMWMVFSGSSYKLPYFGPSSGVSSLSALNGTIAIGCSGTFGAFTSIGFIEDKGYALHHSAYINERTIANRSVNAQTVGTADYYLVNRTVNDVAMTVLPNAPVDAATGLPRVTVAVATRGGCMVFTDSGAAYDITNVNSTYTNALHVDFDSLNNLWLNQGTTATSYDSWVYVFAMPLSADTAITLNEQTATGANPIAMFQRSVSKGASIPFNVQGGDSLIAESSVATSGGLGILSVDYADSTKSMGAEITSTYNTGWMQGDIKGAFLSDTDDTDLVGGNLIPNGDFSSTDLSAWTIDTNSTAQVVAGQLELTATNAFDGMTRDTVQENGAWYLVSIDLISGTGRVGLSVSESSENGSGEPFYNVSKTGPHTFIGYAQAKVSNGSLSLRLRTQDAGATTVWDNLSFIRADANRSVEKKGLTVNGTITKTPVATGADLVAYSGFSNSNYLQQPYNSDLDFGTGDFCIMGWATASGASDWLVDRRDIVGNTYGFHLLMASGTVLRFDTYENNVNSTITGSTALTSAFAHFVALRRNGVMELWVNGNLEGSNSTLRDMSSGTPSLFVGVEGDLTSSYSGSLALLRISGTAPSAEQIAKIYNDEKVLFQENAQATLYGTSDAVTALAHDDATDLLHVGTSGGRSVFQGLRRVENTTDAVGTAISASNGLVVEE